MDANPVDGNHGSNVPRLTILSLKKAVHFIKRESQSIARRNNEENGVNLKSKIENLWFFFKEIIDREKYGRQAIRLIQVISYLGGIEDIDYGFADWEYNNSIDYVYEGQEIFNVLILLDSYGLIQIEGIRENEQEYRNTHNIILPNNSWMSVIREKNGRNPNLEICLLQTCFKMVEEGRYPTWMKNNHFSALSPYLLKYPVLVNHFKKFFLQNYWNHQVTADILEEFENVFGQSDHESMDLRLRHLDTKSENKILLSKFEAARLIFNRDTECTNFNVLNIAKLIYDIAFQSQDVGKTGKLFYEESLQWYRMIQERLLQMGWSDGVLNLFNLKECIEKSVIILIAQDRSKEISDLFRDLRRKTGAKGREQIIINSSNRFGLADFLANMIEFVSKIKNPTLKKSLFGEIFRILDFAFKIVLRTQKENSKMLNMKLCINFSKIVKNLIKCLIEFGQFDEILIVIQETDKVWQESIQILLTQKYWKSVRGINTFTGEYLDVHNLILDTISNNNQDLKVNVELQKIFLRQSVSAFLPVCTSIAGTTLLDYCNNRFGFVSFVGKCLIELNEMNELRIFMNNLEKLLDRPENIERESRVIIIPVRESQGMINFCAMIVRRLTPINGRVEYLLSVLGKTLQIVRRIWIQGRCNGMESTYETTALNIIKVCESNLDH